MIDVHARDLDDSSQLGARDPPSDGAYMVLEEYIVHRFRGANPSIFINYI